MAFKYVKVLDKKEHSPNTSVSEKIFVIPPINFNNNIKTNVSKKGAKIYANNIKMQEKPIEFFIIILEATTKSNPSFKNPPTIGIELPIAYLTAFIETPSKTEEVIP